MTDLKYFDLTTKKIDEDLPNEIPDLIVFDTCEVYKTPHSSDAKYDSMGERTFDAFEKMTLHFTKLARWHNTCNIQFVNLVDHFAGGYRSYLFANSNKWPVDKLTINIMVCDTCGRQSSPYDYYNLSNFKSEAIFFVRQDRFEKNPNETCEGFGPSLMAHHIVGDSEVARERKVAKKREEIVDVEIPLPAHRPHPLDDWFVLPPFAHNCTFDKNDKKTIEVKEMNLIVQRMNNVHLLKFDTNEKTQMLTIQTEEHRLRHLIKRVFYDDTGAFIPNICIDIDKERILAFSRYCNWYFHWRRLVCPKVKEDAEEVNKNVSDHISAFFLSYKSSFCYNSTYTTMIKEFCPRGKTGDLKKEIMDIFTNQFKSYLVDYRSYVTAWNQRIAQEAAAAQRRADEVLLEKEEKRIIAMENSKIDNENRDREKRNAKSEEEAAARKRTVDRENAAMKTNAAGRRNNNFASDMAVSKNADSKNCEADVFTIDGVAPAMKPDPTKDTIIAIAYLKSVLLIQTSGTCWSNAIYNALYIPADLKPILYTEHGTTENFAKLSTRNSNELSDNVSKAFMWISSLIQEYKLDWDRVKKHGELADLTNQILLVASNNGRKDKDQTGATKELMDNITITVLPLLKDKAKKNINLHVTELCDAPNTNRIKFPSGQRILVVNCVFKENEKRFFKLYVSDKKNPNYIYKLVSCLIVNENHAMAGVLYGGIPYIVDSNNFVVDDDWVNGVFTQSQLHTRVKLSSYFVSTAIYVRLDQQSKPVKPRPQSQPKQSQSQPPSAQSPTSPSHVGRPSLPQQRVQQGQPQSPPKQGQPQSPPKQGQSPAKQGQSPPRQGQSQSPPRQGQSPPRQGQPQSPPRQGQQPLPQQRVQQGQSLSSTRQGQPSSFLQLQQLQEQILQLKQQLQQLSEQIKA